MGGDHIGLFYARDRVRVNAGGILNFLKMVPR